MSAATEPGRHNRPAFASPIAPLSGHFGAILGRNR